MKSLLVLSLLVMALLFACSAPVSRPPMEIDAFTLENSITLAKPASKVLYEPLGEKLYALHPQDQTISIYSQGQQQNVLGGLGTGAGNFLRLSDIALAPEGGVVALDMSARMLRKFDKAGQFLSALELKGSQQPALIALGSDDILYVFDQAASEIIVYSMLDGSEQNRFGRFELKQLTQLSCTRDYVVGYDATTDTSQVFSSLGQFVKSETGQIAFDDYNNGISMSQEAITSQMSPAFLPLSEPRGLMTISGNRLILASESTVQIITIDYMQVN